MKPDATPTPAAPRPEPAPPVVDDSRPPLPRRRPQQNLAAQLHDEPDYDDTAPEAVPGEGSARSLAALHKGTRRGREDASES